MHEYLRKCCLEKLRVFHRSNKFPWRLASKQLAEIEKGMKYDEEWLFECILMCMRSPKLYEQLRHQNIWTLPGHTCLNKAVQHFKSEFWFSPNVFTPLQEKGQRTRWFQSAWDCRLQRNKTVEAHQRKTFSLNLLVINVSAMIRRIVYKLILPAVSTIVACADVAQFLFT